MYMGYRTKSGFSFPLIVIWLNCIPLQIYVSFSIFGRCANNNSLRKALLQSNFFKLCDPLLWKIKYYSCEMCCRHIAFPSSRSNSLFIYIKKFWIGLTHVKSFFQLFLVPYRKHCNIILHIFITWSKDFTRYTPTV